MSNRITKEHSERIKIYAATGLYTAQEIACEFDNIYNPNQILNHIKSKAPELRHKIRKESSRGAVKLKYILSKIFPHVTIQSEYHVGEKLRLDFYIGEPYNLGFEFDGVQHDKFTPGLHKDEDEYVRGVHRDERKAQLCEGRGINLIRFNHSETLTMQLVQSKIDSIGFGSGYIKEGFETGKEVFKKKQEKFKEIQSMQRKKRYQQYKKSENYVKHKQKQKEYRKKQYQKSKEFARKINNSRRALESSEPIQS